MPEAATPGTAATRPPYNPVINPVHAKPVLIEEYALSISFPHIRRIQNMS